MINKAIAVLEKRLHERDEQLRRVGVRLDQIEKTTRSLSQPAVGNMVPGEVAQSLRELVASDPMALRGIIAQAQFQTGGDVGIGEPLEERVGRQAFHQTYDGPFWVEKVLPSVFSPTYDRLQLNNGFIHAGADTFKWDTSALLEDRYRLAVSNYTGRQYFYMEVAVNPFATWPYTMWDLVNHLYEPRFALSTTWPMHSIDQYRYKASTTGFRNGEVIADDITVAVVLIADVYVELISGVWTITQVNQRWDAGDIHVPVHHWYHCHDEDLLDMQNDGGSPTHTTCIYGAGWVDPVCVTPWLAFHNHHHEVNYNGTDFDTSGVHDDDGCVFEDGSWDAEPFGGVVP